MQNEELEAMQNQLHAPEAMQDQDAESTQDQLIPEDQVLEATQVQEPETVQDQLPEAMQDQLIYQKPWKTN